MSLSLMIGEYTCTGSDAQNNQTHCALNDNKGGSGQSMPPVVITVDFGDGSGEQQWSRDDPRWLWSHKYQLPGRYIIHVSSE